MALRMRDMRPVIHVCTFCRQPHVMTEYKYRPKFCSERCRKNSYARTNRRRDQRKSAKLGGGICVKRRKDPPQYWGDTAIRAKERRNANASI